VQLVNNFIISDNKLNDSFGLNNSFSKESNRSVDLREESEFMYEKKHKLTGIKLKNKKTRANLPKYAQSKNLRTEKVDKLDDDKSIVTIIKNGINNGKIINKK
jgi:hypothetical protein